MSAKDIFKFNRKTFFNPSGWMDWDRIVQQTQDLWSVLKTLFYPPAAGEKRSFEEVMQEYKLSEADIADGITTYRTIALVFLILGLVMFGYAIYILVTHFSITATFLALAVSALFFSQVFKYDFWALQMRQRNLGLTFADWKRQYLGD